MSSTFSPSSSELLLDQCLTSYRQESWSELNDNLDQLVKLFRDEANRDSFTLHHLNQLEQLINMVDHGSGEKKDDTYYSIYSNIFRVLRNCVAGSPKNCQLIVKHEILFDSLHSWLKNTLDQNNWNDEGFNGLASLKCSLQFLANLVAGSPSKDCTIRGSVWKQFEFDLLRKLFTARDDTLRQITTCFIYNCFLDDKLLRDSLEGQSFQIIELVATDLALNDKPSEWSLFTLQRFLESSLPLEVILEKSSSKNRLVLLDVINEIIKEDNNEEKTQFRIPESNCAMISNLMKTKLNAIAKNECQTWDSNDCQFVLKMLSIVGEIASNESIRSISLDDGDLFRLLIDTLKNLHLLSKARNGNQTPSSDPQNPADCSELTLVGLKKDIVRLIANMSYKRPHLQNLATESDAIPLILDMTRIDKENPFIREWAILATRNLLENNENNQNIVANLTDKQIIADQELVDKLGFKFVGNKVVPKDQPGSK